ncbi:MAG: hypothetical protein JGK01_26805 [Microcoleus sp. PH2017_03_ELD_O_A]|uniref:hypothetical protein n=1 Tax=Microcoleus sp. PH2017_32_RDM_D_A TaxID=2798842 RepID=UPI001DC7E419|nr:hypothetical protein [Microcoleus sp. PH2017_32_RDM_D_A]MCC3431192.1 hypothetical protein [Microcoleus sp. PH2017_04_SCI_O_A]MCC3445211.1 hypothetical protein [Microcoleus sp. PH2017_03_ELD_O_A]MCC3511638.1 hypothetical protein [Microcoleus sp. PH2017_17_BER_D_A]MCC3567949.1 hypothetical protein [Microcoleus sp. PH2017_31_RDM_U_A]
MLSQAVQSENNLRLSVFICLASAARRSKIYAKILITTNCQAVNCQLSTVNCQLSTE